MGVDLQEGIHEVRSLYATRCSSKLLPSGGPAMGLALPPVCLSADWALWMSRVNKGTAGGRAIQIAACSDNQTAADTNAMSRSVHTGVSH